MGRRNLQAEDASVAEVRETVLSHCLPLEMQRLLLSRAEGFTLAADVVAAADIPPFDNSAMDGYAVRAQDLAGRDQPVFEVVEDVPAGTVPVRSLGPGEAAFIMTGAPMPVGGDAVIPVEDAERDGDRVRVLRYEGRSHVRRRGEMTRAGTLALARGARIGPAESAVCASNGLAEVAVHRRPRVGVLSTGDELLLPGEKGEPGKIWACNAQSIGGLARHYGAIVTDFGVVADDEGSVVRALERGLASCDVLVSSGGVSVGEWDHLRSVVTDRCEKAHVWQIRMRPGRPFVFGVRRDGLVFGLPGNPVAVMVSFFQFVRPALLRLQGRASLSAPTVRAVLSEPVRKRPGVVHFLRARLAYREGRFVASTTGPQGSAIVSSMAAAHALLLVGPENTDLAAGDDVDAQILDFKPLLLDS